MALRLIGPIDTAAGLNRLVVAAGDRIDTLNILQVPNGLTLSLYFGSMGPFPLQQGHLFTGLTPSDGAAGVRAVLAATPGSLILVAGVAEA